MSRYWILLILNLPFIILAIVSAITRYKMKHSTRRKMIIQIILWSIILFGLAFAQTFYDWLITSGYTNTESLSLFDVIQITSIVVLLYIVNRLRAKTESLENRLNGIHRELSIKLSEQEK